MAIDINEAKVERNEFGLWAAWTLATAIGMILGYLPSAFLVGAMSLGVSRVVVPILAGILLGIAQWLVLRQYVNGCRDWILNHAGGWVVGFMLGFFVAQLLVNIPYGAVIGFLLFGVIVALFQWPVLRREVPNLWIWILANVIAWTLGAWISGLIAGPIFENTKPSLVFSTVLTVGITGLIGGAITALALVWIVRKPERADFV